MTVDFEQKKLEKVREAANLRDIKFPPCCLSCAFSKAGDEYCGRLLREIDNPFQICDYYYSD